MTSHGFRHRFGRERRLHADAEIELGDAAVYYAEHATPKIAIAFLAEFERVNELLQLNQQLGARKEAGIQN